MRASFSASIAGLRPSLRPRIAATESPARSFAYQVTLELPQRGKQMETPTGGRCASESSGSRRQSPEPPDTGSLNILLFPPRFSPHPPCFIDGNHQRHRLDRRWPEPAALVEGAGLV